MRIPLNRLTVMTAMLSALLGASAWAQRTTEDRLSNQDFAGGIAKAFLVSKGVREPSADQLTTATSDVQSMRDSGMGWGAIANTLGLRLGEVVSAANASDNASGTGQTGSSNSHRGTNGKGGGNSGGGNGGGRGGGNGGGRH